MKGVAGELQRRCVGPFKTIGVIGQQAYKLSLPEDWKIHPVSHVYLSKYWRTTSLQEDQPVPTDKVPDVEKPYYEIARIPLWLKFKKGKKFEKVFNFIEELSH